MNPRFKTLLLLLCIVTLSLWLRWPTLSQGKPFFYDEDEAHHFNRIVTMVKNRTLNPEYFHKPSLHFYLRMPAVIVGFLLEPPRPGSESVKDIRTRDNYGLAKYSFSWSHPRVVLAVRAVSLLMTTISVILVFTVATQLGATAGTALGAAAVFSVSPELFHYSSFIGVDVPLMFFVLLSTSLALQFRKALTLQKLSILGLMTGLAVSSKYNGAPIALLPLLLVCESGTLRNFRFLAIALAAPVVGFFLGSPYILLSFELFYKQLSYEVWHYAVAGHEGHMAEPGIAQIIHYGTWLMSDGIGAVATVLALSGIVLLITNSARRATVFLLFPVLFFALMCAQRANFVRNMIPILPYCAVLAAVTIGRATERLNLRKSLLCSLTVLACIIPLRETLDLRRDAATFVDTRVALYEWLREQEPNEVAITGDIQPQESIRQMPGVAIVPPSTSVSELYQNGFDLLAVLTRQGQPSIDSSSSLVSVENLREFSGSLSSARVLKSPTVTVYRLNPVNHPQQSLLPSVPLPLTDEQFNATPDEPYRWINERVVFLKFPTVRAPTEQQSVRFELMSPWKGQQIELIGTDWHHRILLNQQNPGEWGVQELNVPRGALIDGEGLILRIARISSPASRNLSSDTRRLGIALREFLVNGTASQP